MALQIEEILALQAVDSEIGKLQTERAALDHGERVERAVAIRRAKLAAAERRLQNLEAEQRATELELKSLEDKKHEESRKLYEGRITAPRELQALEMEIASLERRRQKLDETILRRMEDIEAARKTYEAAKQAVEEGDKALRIVRRRYQKALERIEGELAALEPKRAELAKKIEPPVLKRYDDIRRRNHNIGAVRVENGACGGCRMKIGTAVLQRLRSGDAYVYCESCSRFLFPEQAE